MRLALQTRSVLRWTLLLALVALAAPAQALAVGQLEVTKALVPAEDPGRFNLLIDGTVYAESVQDGGSTGKQTVTTGTHQVQEAAGPGSGLDAGLWLYAKSIACRDQGGAGAIVAQTPFDPNNPDIVAGGGPLDVPVAEGADVVCVITNKRAGITKITEYTANPEQLPNMPVPPYPLTQAGGHPNMRIYMRFCDRNQFTQLPPPQYQLLPGGAGCTQEQLFTALKDFRLRLPAGMIGNPTAVPQCPYHLYLAFSCPAATRVGYSFTMATNGFTNYSAPIPLVVVQTLGWEPARLGTGDVLPTLPQGPLPIQISVRTADDPKTPQLDADFGIDSLLSNIPSSPPGGSTGDIGAIPVNFIDTVLCSDVPCVAPSGSSDVTAVQALPGARPFMVNPTSCKPAAFELEAVGWDAQYKRETATSNKELVETSPGSGTFETRQTDPWSTTGCTSVDATAPTPENESPTGANPPFNLNADVAPESSQAGAATPVTVRLRYCRAALSGAACEDESQNPRPTDYSFDEIWQANLRDADVTLPEGMTLSASGGNGLKACSYEQFYGPDVHSSSDASYDRRTDDPVTCPAGSQIGTLRVETPALSQPIEGKAFFGPTSDAFRRPTVDRPWKLFLLLEGQGLRIKLRAGDVSLSETGQVRTIFKGNPEVPFSKFELTTNGGTNAVLRNPTTCGTHLGRVEFTSHGDASPGTPTVIRQPAVETTDCPEPQPFQPILNDASASPQQAGANSVSHLNFRIPDGHRDLRTLTLHLPPGAVGSLAASELCPAAIVNALATDPNANCPDSTKVGTIRTTVGSGSSLLTTPGKVYIGEAIRFGDAASFVIVVPAKVGPIDLGRVVLVNRARLRESDTGIDVFAEAEIPRILEGVPLPIREIDITIDREGFFLNPTSCASHLFVADFTSYPGTDGAPSAAQGTFPTAATGCDALDFRPKLRIIAGGNGLTDNKDNPSLKAIVTQSKGEANIANAKVTIPDIIRPDVPQIQKPGTLCTDGTGRTCPPASQVGTASVITPVLPFQLQGPVYITLQPGQPLPNLVVFLRGPGGLEVVLRASNGFSGIRILNTFKDVPDVPQSRFELNVKGGPDGILLNYKDLCTTNPLPDVIAEFTGHNGKVFKDTPQLEADGCLGASRARGAYISKRPLKLRKNGTVRVKLTCAGRVKLCRGRVTIQSPPRKAKASRTFGRKSYRITKTRGRVIVKLDKKTVKRVKRQKRIRSRVVATTVGGKTAKRVVTIKR